MNERIEILLSKTKLALLIAGASLFVFIGLFLIIDAQRFGGVTSATEITFLLLGIATVLLFGGTLIFLIRKLFDRRIGLTIDDRGITDHSSGTSVGLIEWEDIYGLETLKIYSTKFIMLQTDVPEKYIARAPNGFSRRAMQTNYKWYGSPLAISANALKIKFNELESLLGEELKRRKR